MSKVGIFYCKRIQDHSCIGCIKCYKGAKEKNGEFSRYKDDVEIVFKTDCGDCPGLIMPRTALVMKLAEGMDMKPDVIHFSTCIKKAVDTAGCRLDIEGCKEKIENMLGIPVVTGTHDYP
jgi:predicted metal-binding protein